ncbi:MAG: hypothetical protein WCC53_02645 [Thermoanaerobaculia bacterium]|jgi:hypothetical protein
MFRRATVLLLAVPLALPPGSALAQAKALRLPAATPTPTPPPAKAAPASGALASSAVGAGTSMAQILNTPAHFPDRLDFDAVFDGSSSMKTFSLTTTAAGYLRAEIPRGPFFVTEIRELGPPKAGGSKNSLGPPQPVISQETKGKISFPEGQPGPWTYGAGVGNQVLIHVVFKPKFDFGTMMAGPKSATMRVSGPGPRGPWALNVPLSGFFSGIKINLAMTLSPHEVEAIAPAPTADLVATIVGVNAAAGTLKATKLPPGVSMAPVSVNVSTGQTVQVPLKLQLSWGALAADAVSRDGEITFEFTGGSSKAGFSFAGLPSSLNGGFANRSDCGIASAGAAVFIYPGYFILEARGDNLDLLNNRVVYLEVRSGGKLLGGGILHFQLGTSRSNDFKRWDSRNVVTNVDFNSVYPGQADYAWVAHHPVSVGCRLVDGGFMFPSK